MAYFDFERFDVYRTALEFLKSGQPIVSRNGRSRGELGDQLQRAAVSIVLNIAEGAADVRPGEKRRFYRMALRSASECASILDVSSALEPHSGAELTPARDLLHRAGAMLAKLANVREARRLAGRVESNRGAESKPEPEPAPEPDDR